MSQPLALTAGLKKSAKRISKPLPSWLRRAREQQARWRVPDVPFPVGQKQVFLPNFTITLLRTPFLAPKWAQFMVPLSLNKFDLRDYLLHLYGVRTLAVRSFIKQLPITRVRKGSVRDVPGRRRLYRPRSLKRMTVELDRPFVWPAVPDDLEPWDNTRYHQLMDEAEGRVRGTTVPSARKTIAEQAQALLRGQMVWKKGQDLRGM